VLVAALGTRPRIQNLCWQRRFVCRRPKTTHVTHCPPLILCFCPPCRMIIFLLSLRTRVWHWFRG
jgi:hypothetical protein